MKENLSYKLFEIEIALEDEEYSDALKMLMNLKNSKEHKKSEQYYLVDFFIGQAKFRIEMEKKNPEIKNIERLISHFEKSLSLKPDFIDAHILAYMSLLVKARLCSNKKEILEKALKHVQSGLKYGITVQKEYCLQQVDFINNFEKD